MNGEKRIAYRLLVGEQGGRPRCRSVDNVKINIGEILWSGME
jgi:hypothetical protein